MDCRCSGLLFSFVLLLAFPCHSSSGQTVPAMYVFGDSLVDVGNNNHLPFSLLKADFPHNGVDYPGRQATGRFSNGKNAADFLAEKLGLQSPPPYLSVPSGSDGVDIFLKGVNFASGGAGILNTTNKDKCLSLDKQIELFSKVYGALVQQLGGAETQRHLARSIVAVVVGSNDLLGYFNSGSSQRAKATPQQFADQLALTLRAQLRRMYNLGARKIVYVGTGPIGCCPSQRLRSDAESCAADSNYGSSALNERVRSLLEGMKLEFGDVNYSFFDAYASLMQFIQNPATYGFVDVKSACCGLGDLNAKVACLPISTYCSNRRDHVFWDFYHPTEAAARLFSDAIFDGSRSLVHPYNVRQLAAL